LRTQRILLSIDSLSACVAMMFVFV